MLARLIFLATTGIPGAALAHAGHIADTAGHDHWIALGAIGLAGAIALPGVLGGRGSDRKRAGKSPGPGAPEGEEATA